MKKKSIVILTIIILMVISIFLLVMLLQKMKENTSQKDENDKNSKYNVEKFSYKFEGNSENFVFKNGIIYFSDKYGSLEISNFSLKENSFLKDEKNITKLEIANTLNGKLWSKDNYNLAEDGELSKWLSNDAIFIEMPNNRCRIYNKDCGKSITYGLKQDEFPDNLRIDITYCIDKLCKTENLEISIIESDLEIEGE